MLIVVAHGFAVLPYYQHTATILYQPPDGFSRGTALHHISTGCFTAIAPSFYLMQFSILLRSNVPLIDVNVAKRDLSVPISATSMMLKMMKAVIKMLMTMTMSHLMLIMLMMIMTTMMMKRRKRKRKTRAMNRIHFILVREL